MMEDVLFTAHPELRAFVSVYIDDIIIATEGEGLTEAELVALHEKQLNQVLDILDANQLICGPKKGKLFLKSVEFCGSLLENGTRRPSPGKLVAIQKWKRPETITELRGFLGCCNFYHTFVPNYAKFAAPLTELLKVRVGISERLATERSFVCYAQGNLLTNDVLTNDGPQAPAAA